MKPLPEVSLHVWLRDLRQFRSLHRMPDKPFLAHWPEGPAWDAAALASFESGELLRAWSPYSRMDSERADALVATTELEGVLGVEPATPEEAWLAMTAELVHSRRAFRIALDALFQEEFGVGWTDAQPEHFQALDLARFPRQDTERLRELAVWVQEQWPDHPVRDHALLAELMAHQASGPDVEWSGEEAVRLLDGIRDPALQGYAAGLAVGSHTDIEGVLERLERVDLGPDEVALHRVAAANARAMRAGLWGAAARWSVRLDTLVTALCGVEEPSIRLQCDERRGEVRRSRVRLAVVGEREPATWQEALEVAAWRCHREAPHEGVSRTSAVWDGTRWDLGAWDRTTPVTDCLAGARPSLVPDAPVRVALTLDALPEF